MNIVPCVTLNNGIEMPVIGLGTFPMGGPLLNEAIGSALSCGYRSFDTARDYGNEREVGCFMQRQLGHCEGLKREQLFITTKIGNGQQVDYKSGRRSIYKDIENSLCNLGLEYIDLLLMHWPYPEHYLYTWDLMEQLYQDQLVRAIGVCNFRERHLVRLLDHALICPAVNQIEIHPLHTNKATISFCKEHTVQVEAYCPLGLMDSRIRESSTLCAIAEKYGKSISQVILRWDYQNELVSVPKSSSDIRIRENLEIFDFSLSEEEMGRIDAMNENYKFYSESFYCPGY